MLYFLANIKELDLMAFLAACNTLKHFELENGVIHFNLININDVIHITLT